MKDTKSLFYTPAPFFHDDKEQVIKKVKLRDSWGNTAFQIKGQPPSWVKDIQVPEVKDEKLRTLSFSQLVESSTKDKNMVQVLPINKVFILGEKEVCEISLFKIKSKKIFVRKAFIDLIEEMMGKVTYYASDSYRSIVVKKNRSVVAVVAPMKPDIFVRPSGKIISPMEALRIMYKNREVKQNDDH